MTTDAFGNDVTTRTNVLDLASHYPYSPERWRLFVDGSRIFPEYATPDLNGLAQYSHGRIGGSEPADVHTLSPNGGETVVMESAERPLYVVQFELASTTAAVLNQSLQGSDRFRVGLYDGSDGWFLEQTADHAPARADVVSLRGGAEVYRINDVPLRVPTTRFARNRLATGWYNLTRQRWGRSYSTNGKQNNELVTRASDDDGRGPLTGNLPIRYEIRADGSTTGLKLYAGSAAQVNLGSTTPFKRAKRAIHTDTIGTTGTWVPLRAIRSDPAREIVNVQLVELRTLEYSAGDDVELLAVACDPSKVLDTNGETLDAADYSTPEEHTAANSVIETSTAVEQFPDSTGTPTTSADDPGGFQTGHAALFDGSGNSIAGTGEGRGEQKRPLYGRDTVVVLGKSGTGGDVTWEHATEQDW